MKPYSVDLREKIVSAIEKGDSSVRKVALRYGVGKNFVQKLVTQKRTEGHILPGKQGGSMVSPVMKHQAQLMAIFEKQTDATLAEYCELLLDETGLWVSQSTMCRTFQRLGLPLKKAARPRVADRRKGMLAKTKRSAPVKPRVSEFNSSEQSIGNK
jgi:transposase